MKKVLSAPSPTPPKCLGDVAPLVDEDWHAISPAIYMGVVLRVRGSHPEWEKQGTHLVERQEINAKERDVVRPELWNTHLQKSTEPRQNPMSVCSLVKLGLLGPEQMAGTVLASQQSQ